MRRVTAPQAIDLSCVCDVANSRPLRQATLLAAASRVRHSRRGVQDLLRRQ
jgi:hypothetical protein